MVRRVRDLSCGSWRIDLDVEIRRVLCQSCGMVQQERLAWLADNPVSTKRFAFAVGRRRRGSTRQDVAKEFHLKWKMVKALEKPCMGEQFRRVGTPGPKVIGIDAISIRKGQTSRLGVSDLVRRRPIWFGGQDRRVIKGQKYTLLSHRVNRTLDGRRVVRTLLWANTRRHRAFLLEESPSATRIPAPQSSHVHAARTLAKPRITHSFGRRPEKCWCSSFQSNILHVVIRMMA